MPDSHITIAGNVARDPELRFTTGGKGQCLFSVAVARRFQVNGSWEETTSFFNVVVWDKIAEHTAASVKKGDRVIVTGRIEQRSYETKEGEKRSTVELTAEDVGLSLKWNPAESERIERTGGGRPKPKEQDPVYGDEEPF